MIAFLWGDNLIVVALRLAFRSIIVANFGCLFAEYSFRLIVHFFFAHHKLRYLSNWYIILKERAKNRIEIGSSIDLCHQYYVIYFWGRFEGGIKIFESMLINWNIILWFLKEISFFISLWIKKLKYEQLFFLLSWKRSFLWVFICILWGFLGCWQLQYYSIFSYLYANRLTSKRSHILFLFIKRN